MLVCYKRYRHFRHRQHFERKLGNDNEAAGSTSAQSLEKLFSSVELAMNTCNDYAVSRFDSIEKFKNDPDTLERYNDSVGQLIKNVLNNTDAAISGYIRYNPELKLSSDGVFWVKDSDKIIAHQPTPIQAYDKDDAEHVAWYYEPLKAKNRSG